MSSFNDNLLKDLNNNLNLDIYDEKIKERHASYKKHKIEIIVIIIIECILIGILIYIFL